MVTDPLLTAWQDAKGNEATDDCRNFFASTAGEGGSHGEIAGSATAVQETEAGTLSNVTVGAHSYYLNNVFSLADFTFYGNGMHRRFGLVPKFTAPNPVNAGEIVGFDGMESEISLITTPAYTASGSLVRRTPLTAGTSATAPRKSRGSLPALQRVKCPGSAPAPRAPSTPTSTAVHTTSRSRSPTWTATKPL